MTTRRELLERKLQRLQEEEAIPFEELQVEELPDPEYKEGPDGLLYPIYREEDEKDLEMRWQMAAILGIEPPTGEAASEPLELEEMVERARAAGKEIPTEIEEWLDLDREIPDPEETESETEKPEEAEDEGMPEFLSKWGSMRRSYLRDAKEEYYEELMREGTLKEHCLEIQRTAIKRAALMEKQFMKAEGATEELKRTNWFAWHQKYQMVQHQIEEIICAELIYQ